MEILKEKYSITELSEILQLTDHTLRFYEKELGLAVPKDERGRRYYTEDLANLMYKIKVMRNEGLEIKAIKKILQDDPASMPVVAIQKENSDSVSILSPQNKDYENMQLFFQEIGRQLTQELTVEITAAKDQLSGEIYKSKQELGACVENSIRKLENKMEKHYQDVDRALGLWREKNKKNPFKWLFSGKKIKI